PLPLLPQCVFGVHVHLCEPAHTHTHTHTHIYTHTHTHTHTHTRHAATTQKTSRVELLFKCYFQVAVKRHRLGNHSKCRGGKSEQWWDVSALRHWCVCVCVCVCVLQITHTA